MKIFLCLLIVLCVAGIVAVGINTVQFWKKSETISFEEKAKGLQKRLLAVPVLLVLICLLAVMWKQIG